LAGQGQRPVKGLEGSVGGLRGPLSGVGHAFEQYRMRWKSTCRTCRGCGGPKSLRRRRFTRLGRDRNQVLLQQVSSPRPPISR